LETRKFTPHSLLTAAPGSPKSLALTACEC
jgi:hypothetical protein